MENSNSQLMLKTPHLQKACKGKLLKGYKPFLNEWKSNICAEQANYLNTQAPLMAHWWTKCTNTPGVANHGFDVHVSNYESMEWRRS